jgi:uncharacterized protein (DUF1697 family)
VARQVALLRGINVGGRNPVPMADLRAVFETLGHTEVTTFIQSGNVIFTTAGPVTAKSLEVAIADRFDINASVVLRTPRELERIVEANPFAGADIAKLHVGFMPRKPPAGAVSKLDAERFRPEELAIRGRELYFHLPDGMGRSRLPAYVDRRLEIPTTVRNWNTVTKLLELTR